MQRPRIISLIQNVILLCAQLQNQPAKMVKNAVVPFVVPVIVCVREYQSSAMQSSVNRVQKIHGGVFAWCVRWIFMYARRVLMNKKIISRNWVLIVKKMRFLEIKFLFFEKLKITRPLNFV